MVVNYEFLDKEPIDNLVTCLNFKVDKVVYLGFDEDIAKFRDRLEKFLSKYCDVKEVVFREVPKYDLQSIFDTLRSEVTREQEKGSEVYFDLTGGAHLVLVAFGMLSMQTRTPMHMFDVAGDRLIELDEDKEAGISRNVEQRKVPLTLDMMIEMHGGAINYNLQKESKEIRDPKFAADVEKIYEVAIRHWEYWNPFSDHLKRLFTPPARELTVCKSMPYVQSCINKSETKLNSVKTFNEIIKDLKQAGMLSGVDRSDGKYSITYKNKAIRDCLWGGGTILELHTYMQEKEHSDDCRIGTHLDWDGVIHKESGNDLMNEIDVLSLNDNVMTFISCKSGKMNYTQILHALYELDTVAKWFGGKYCRKVLVSAKPLSKIYMERAGEMKIEVRVVTKQ